MDAGALEKVQVAAASVVAAALVASPANAGVVLQQPELKKVELCFVNGHSCFASPLQPNASRCALCLPRSSNAVPYGGPLPGFCTIANLQLFQEDAPAPAPVKREYKPFSVGLPSAPAPKAEGEKVAEAPKPKKAEAAESSSGPDLDPRSIALPGG